MDCHFLLDLIESKEVVILYFRSKNQFNCILLGGKTVSLSIVPCSDGLASTSCMRRTIRDCFFVSQINVLCLCVVPNYFVHNWSLNFCFGSMRQHEFIYVANIHALKKYAFWMF